MLHKSALVPSYNYIVVIREYPTPYESEDGYQEREEKGDEETTERCRRRGGWEWAW
jgi:hypothetical protein